MKIKPKELLVNLPVVLLFNGEDSSDQAAQFASNVNTIIHGKVKMKVEGLGTLGGQLAVIFYLQRNNEFTELREQFMKMIEAEEMGQLIQEEPTTDELYGADPNADPWGNPCCHGTPGCTGLGDKHWCK